MILCIHLFYNIGDHTVLIYYKSSPHRSHISTTGHLFLPPHTEGLVQFTLGIGYKRKRQRLLLDKLAMRCLAVLAHAYHGIARCCMLRQYTRAYCLSDKNKVSIYFRQNHLAESPYQSDLHPISRALYLLVSMPYYILLVYKNSVQENSDKTVLSIPHTLAFVHYTNIPLFLSPSIKTK